MGVTTGAASPAIRLERRLGEAVEDVDGGVDAGGVVAGTYIHGLFANVGLRRAMLDWLARRKGLTLSYGEDATREAAYDRLAEVVRSSLDMRMVRELCWVDLSSLGTPLRPHPLGPPLHCVERGRPEAAERSSTLGPHPAAPPLSRSAGEGLRAAR